MSRTIQIENAIFCRVITYAPDFCVIETNDLSKIQDAINDHDVCYYIIHDLQNKELYTRTKESDKLNPIPIDMDDDQSYDFSYGENLDKHFSITINGCIQSVSVYTRKDKTPSCIYNSKWKVYTEGVSDAAV